VRRNKPKAEVRPEHFLTGIEEEVHITFILSLFPIQTVQVNYVSALYATYTMVLSHFYMSMCLRSLDDHCHRSYTADKCCTCNGGRQICLERSRGVLLNDLIRQLLGVYC
jgi:hypothetical protein